MSDLSGWPDPSTSPLSKDVSVSHEEFVAAFEELILSASGWRKVFAADRDEESSDPSCRPVDLLLVALMALVYERYFRVRFPDESAPVIAVGTDTRDTGPALADVIIRVLASQGMTVRYLSMAAAPEIMAYVGQSSDIDGFVYVSASHNPRGHNGVKFGFHDGSVIGGEDAETMRELFRQTAYDAQTVPTLREVVDSAPSVQEVYKAVEETKATALSLYRTFIRTVVGGSEGLEALRGEGRLGVVVDFNGSARTLSIDRDFLGDLGLELHAINDAPRQIAHQIVPEGEGLEQCRVELEKLHRASPSFVFGYVPDNDGDRGNLVYVDGDAARSLGAQETFALACIAELAWLVYTGKVTYSPEGRARQKVAVVVNGPTSLRIDRIANAFDAAVFRAEVGEANVVTMARTLRGRGFLVPVLGEGSNGGTITHPSTVRDPLATIGAVSKLLIAPDKDAVSAPFKIWLARRGHELAGAPERTIPGILQSVPPFATTSAFDGRAKLAIRTTDHAALKAHYERVFKAAWPKRREELADRFGIRTWGVINYEGTNETHGVGGQFRSGAQRGGFKVLFKNQTGIPVAFLWMRGSGTEPVFRIMADVEGGNSEDEAFLLDWHAEMIRKADEAAAGRGAG